MEAPQKSIFFSPTGNRTRVSRVTGGDTDLYTIEDSEMISESAKPSLELTLISGPVRFPSNFRCYEGIQNMGMNSSCDNHCRYGIDCMCIKIDNVPGKMNDSCGTARAVLNQDTTGSFFSFSWPCVSQVTAQCEAAGRILTQHWLPDAWLITSGYEHYKSPTTLLPCDSTGVRCIVNKISHIKKVLRWLMGCSPLIEF